MPRWLKWVVVCAIAVVFLFFALGTYAFGWATFSRALVGPKARAVGSRSFESTPERLERGRYLVDGPMHCFECHSPVDWTDPSLAVPEGKEGSGAYMDVYGLPGEVFTPNITPDPETGIGNWTDDEIARAIREGVSRDGRALFPLMPYKHFRNLSDEDLASVIVYLRSIPPVKNPVPKSRIDFPVSRLINADPQPVIEPVAEPDRTDPVEYGRYLVQLGNCITCHTAADPAMHPRAELFLAGGFELYGPWGHVFGPNITPDASGIAYYDEERFLEVMRTGKVGARQLNQIMPVVHFRNLSDQDLKAIYTYLRSLKPIKHEVDNTEPPTFCELCNGTHGYGNRN